jgi:hypothetical protein
MRDYCIETEEYPLPKATEFFSSDYKGDGLTAGVSMKQEEE